MNLERDSENPSPLRGLSPEIAPPAALEERTVGELRRRGQFGRRPRWGWTALAASLLGLVVGWWAHQAAPPASVPVESSAPLYLLLLSGEPPRGPQGEERVEAYRQWARALAAEGKLAGAEKLDDRFVSVEEGAAVAGTADDAGPSGYFLVHARDLDEAIAMARESPHVRFGGRVTVRPVDPT